MKTVGLFGSRYVAMGVVGASLLLAACSSGGGGAGQTPGAAAPASTSAPAIVANTPAPTPERGTVVNTPTPTSAPARQASPSPAAVTEAEIREIRVTLKNNTFPKEIRVQAGEAVVFVITNEANEKHSFEITDFDFYQDIEAGRTARFEWVVPDKKGQWDMGCYLTVPDEVHEDMEGTLIIE